MRHTPEEIMALLRKVYPNARTEVKHGVVVTTAPIQRSTT